LLVFVSTDIDVNVNV